MSGGAVTSFVQREYFLRAPFDLIPEEAVCALLSHRGEGASFRYIVTPNVDHVVRLWNDASLVTLYQSASLSICDSKPIVLLAAVLGLKLPHFPGSALTETIFKSVIGRGDRVAVVAATDRIATDLAATFPEVDFVSLVPPMGIGTNRAALQACVDFVATSGADFTFIAIGSPQSERIAFEASRDPRTRGIGLCVGAGLEFLVGRKRRAPSWMQKVGLEWLYRLGSEPRRLWRRYVFGFLPFAYLAAVETLERGWLKRDLRSRSAGG